MLTISDRFPDYSLTALIPGDLSQVQVREPEDYFMTVTSDAHPGKWRVVFFWPKDFTFVCPTEIAEFGRKNHDFEDRNAVVLGASVDNEYVHFAWRTNHPSLRDLPFPMLADIKRELTSACGVLNSDGVADRATFIVDPEGTVQFVMVTAGDVGRNVDEVIRVLDALQTGELCPCDWHPGTETLQAAELMDAGALTPLSAGDTVESCAIN